MDTELTLRLIVLRPPAGVAFRVQSGRADLVAPVSADPARIAFTVRVRLRGSQAEASPDFAGPCVQGPRGARFVYVNSGTLAGQADSCWTRRAKVPLRGITWEQALAAQSAPGAALEAAIEGTGRNGGPACASVPLLGDGWELARDEG